MLRTASGNSRKTRNAIGTNNTVLLNVLESLKRNTEEFLYAKRSCYARKNAYNCIYIKLI